MSSANVLTWLAINPTNSYSSNFRLKTLVIAADLRYVTSTRTAQKKPNGGSVVASRSFRTDRVENIPSKLFHYDV
jgi:hypothetical protein